MPPITPGAITPGWVNSVYRPRTPMIRSTKKTSGSTMRARNFCRPDNSKGVSLAFESASFVLLPSKRVISRPLSCRTKSSTLGATRSIILPSRASLSVKALAGDRGFGQRWVAPALFRVAAQEGQGVVENLALHGFVDLQLPPADGNDRRSGSGVRAGSHGGNIRGEQDEETSGSAASASGRDVHGDRNARRQDVLDDVLHGIAEAAGRVHGDENQGRLAALGIRDAFIDIGGEDGLDDAVQIQVEDDRSGSVFVRRGGRKKGKECEGGESGENKMPSRGLKAA